MADGSNDSKVGISKAKGSLQDDLCGADPSLLADYGCQNVSSVSQRGYTEEIEPDTAVGMAIETQGRTNYPESMQNQ